MKHNRILPLIGIIAAGFLGLLSLARGWAPAQGAKPDPALVGFWPLRDDAKDASGHGLDGQIRGVGFTFDSLGGGPRSAQFPGRGAWIEVPDSKELDLGTGDFSIAVWVRTPARLADTIGDILSKFDPRTRCGINLSIMQSGGACTSMANTRNLFFGIDAGRISPWRDCGRPGRAILVFGLAVYDSDLYAATYEGGADEAGHVYRYRGGQDWEDCGSPDLCNSVTSLAVHDGRLFAGTARYNATGSHLTASPNVHDGGRVFRYEGGRRWVDCGKVGLTECTWGLMDYDGVLYASLMDSPNVQNRPGQGLYAYRGGTTWEYCGNPGGRVAALSAHDRHLYASGYDGGELGGVFRYDGGQKWTDFGPPPWVTQTYSYAVSGGELLVGTWPDGTVFKCLGPRQWINAGRLGEEKEVMGMAVYNGKLYGGTLPLAQIYRRDGDSAWTLTGRLDMTPGVEYRRAWSMAVFEGKLFCGVLPSGHVWSLEAGKAVTWDRALAPEWRHIAAVKDRGLLKLYVDGVKVAGSTEFAPAEFNLANDAPLKIGFGEHDYFKGGLRNLYLFGRALSDVEVMKMYRTGIDGSPVRRAR